MESGDVAYVPRPTHHLTLLADPHLGRPGIVDEVRSARRDMARLLRALHASGRSVASWPDELVTRLAHVDAVTARVLIGHGVLAAREAVQALRTIERWIVDRLQRSELAEIRVFELMIRVEDHELEAPLIRPDRAPEDDIVGVEIGAGAPVPRSLRGGLETLDDYELSVVCRRLGVRPLSVEKDDGCPARSVLEAEVGHMLRDDHLLSILVATLASETQELLAAVIRGTLGAEMLHRLATAPPVVGVVGGSACPVSSPAMQLRACGLAFVSTHEGRARLWVPVELQYKLDGVLRTFGI
jgi:hypothetical protein